MKLNLWQWQPCLVVTLYLLNISCNDQCLLTVIHISKKYCKEWVKRFHCDLLGAVCNCFWLVEKINNPKRKTLRIIKKRFLYWYSNPDISTWTMLDQQIYMRYCSKRFGGETLCFHVKLLIVTITTIIYLNKINSPGVKLIGHNKTKTTARNVFIFFLPI